jgi:arginyl-tRNA synthetase
VIREELVALVTKAIKRAQREGELPAFDPPVIEITRPKELSHGDYTCSVAMQSARLARQAPIKIAEAIIKRLPAAEFLAGSEAVAPGFINFRLNEAWLAGQVAAIEAAGDHYGQIDLGHGKRLQVEFISANPTGPLHMGSARNAVLGDTMANVYAAAGYQVQREYYLNDAGTQMRTFSETLYLRYQQQLGREAPLESHHYQGAYMSDLARDVVAAEGDRYLQMTPDEAIDALGKLGLQRMIASIRASAELMHIHFDEWFSEASLYTTGIWDKVMARLREDNLTEFKDGAVWLRTSQLGSDRDEVLIRSDGRPGYYASDVAYHYNKFAMRGFDQVVDVWAVDHQNQARRMPHLMKALGLDPNRLTIMLYDFVRLYRDGQEVKLSKRSGDIITVDEVAQEVGIDAIRFLLLTRSSTTVLDFDLNLAVKQNDENPVFYVQYAHTRMASILRTAEERGFFPADWQQADVNLLKEPAELLLIRKVLELPEIIEKAATTLSPHHLVFYAMELAGVFHSFYRDCRVLSSVPEERAISAARLRLVSATKAVFARVLGLTGVTAPETM